MERSLTTKKEFDPIEKVAILLASLDETTAAKVLQHLEPKLVLQVTRTIRELGVVPGSVRDSAINDCLTGIREMGRAISGDEEMANALLTQALGEKRAATLLTETPESKRNAFPDLAEMDPEQVASILAREQTGIIALVLRYLPNNMAAEILNILPPDISKKVVVFMCTCEPPSDEVVTRVENLMSSQLGPHKKARKVEGSSNVDIVSNIIQHTKRSVEADLLSAIEEKSEGIANQVRDRLFTFEDIVRLSDVAMRRLMSEIDMEALAVALRNASPEVQERFFGNMSKRAAEGLREEMEYAQKVRMSEIEAKQREIVNTIRALESDGQLSTGGEDEYV
jgi:flagellar motor switch protein FliG